MCIRDRSSTHAFTRSLFEAIVTEDGLDILNGYDKESFKAYYNGNTQITGGAKQLIFHIIARPFSLSFLSLIHILASVYSL